MNAIDTPPRGGPVFVVGMNGSGTTMLADSLGRHPGLYMFPHETWVLPYFAKTLERFGDLGTLPGRVALAHELGRQKAFWHTNGKRDLVLDESALAAPGFAGVVDAVFQHFARQQGKVRWGEKSPMHLGHMKLLASHFPEARFVHIIRDGRDAAQSFHRRYGYVPEESVWRWKTLLAEGRAQGAALGPERYHEVQYEALTADPQTAMRALCAFIGLPYDPVVTESSMRMVDPNVAAGAGGRIIENSEKWRDYFSPRQVAALERIAGRMLQELGYPVAITGDRNPPGWKLKWWTLRGKVARTIRHFQRWGLDGLPGYLRSIGASLRQKRAGRM